MSQEHDLVKKNNFIVVRGGGDLATGVIHTLWKHGYHVLILETSHPSAIRRKVAFSEAIYTGEMEVEGACARLVSKQEGETWHEFFLELEGIWMENKIPILVDSAGESIVGLKPRAVIDAIIAKKNLGTHIDMAPVTIALGPGFEAGVDVHYVIETMRGETLGQVITEGYALKNTGIPGAIAGISKDRVIHAPSEGVFRNVKSIGNVVEKGEVIAYIEPDVKVQATIDGVLRGLLRDGYFVTRGFKIADIDPRLEERENCNNITDKAKKIGKGVLDTLVG